MNCPYNNKAEGILRGVTPGRRFHLLGLRPPRGTAERLSLFCRGPNADRAASPQPLKLAGIKAPIA